MFRPGMLLQIKFPSDDSTTSYSCFVIRAQNPRQWTTLPKGMIGLYIGMPTWPKTWMPNATGKSASCLMLFGNEYYFVDPIALIEYKEE